MKYRVKRNVKDAVKNNVKKRCNGVGLYAQCKQTHCPFTDAFRLPQASQVFAPASDLPSAGRRLGFGCAVAIGAAGATGASVLGAERADSTMGSFGTSTRTAGCARNAAAAWREASQSCER